MGNHYKLIDAQSYLGKTIYNVMHWEAISGSPSAEELNTLYNGVILPTIVAWQSDLLTHQQLVSVCIEDVSDYNDMLLTTGNVGLNAGSALMSFVAAAFRLTRSERGHHHGAIRFAGVTESEVEDGVAESTFVTALNTTAAALEAPLAFGGSATYALRIHRAANSIKPAYNNAEAFYNPSSVAFVRVTTQNSRK